MDVDDTLFVVNHDFESTVIRTLSSFLGKQSQSIDKQLRVDLPRMHVQLNGKRYTNHCELGMQIAKLFPSVDFVVKGLCTQAAFGIVFDVANDIVTQREVDQNTFIVDAGGPASVCVSCVSGNDAGHMPGIALQKRFNVIRGDESACFGAKQYSVQVETIIMFKEKACMSNVCLSSQ